MGKDGERNGKRGALSELTAHLNGTAMRFYKRFDNVQAQPAARYFAFMRFFGAEIGLKQLI